ncbi:hypothetical protein ABZ915_33240 [Streptomyces sp. NPDC046915]
MTRRLEGLLPGLAAGRPTARMPLHPRRLTPEPTTTRARDRNSEVRP